MKRLFGFLLAAVLMLCGPALADPAGSPIGGSAGSQSYLSGCIYQSSPSTMSNGQQTGLRCNSAGNMQVSVVPGGSSGSTSTDISGTVTLGGTYQTALAANTARKGCLIQNPTTATEILSVKVGTMATAYSLPIGATFSCASAGGLIVTDAITLTAATTSHAFAGVSQ